MGPFYIPGKLVTGSLSAEGDGVDSKSVSGTLYTKRPQGQQWVYNNGHSSSRTCGKLAAPVIGPHGSARIAEETLVWGAARRPEPSVRDRN